MPIGSIGDSTSGRRRKEDEVEELSPSGAQTAHALGKLWPASSAPPACAMPQYSPTGDVILTIFIATDTITRIDTIAKHYLHTYV